MKTNAINARLAYLETCFAEIDALIVKHDAIVASLAKSLCDVPNGTVHDALFAACEAAHAEIAQLRADRAELDAMWNEALAVGWYIAA